ncbi:MAG: hypothetical protein K0Q73_7537 [Paenibacillus sp.]|jgi:predicted CopG family antitoxin|nr:hypothetical protein [Paenibacillus sp.]
MAKQLEDAKYLQYKKQLAELMQKLNPKPSLEDIEKLKKMYLEKRATLEQS